MLFSDSPLKPPAKKIKVDGKAHAKYYKEVLKEKFMLKKIKKQRRSVDLLLGNAADCFKINNDTKALNEKMEKLDIGGLAIC